jgi:threonine/homoserine/homoserine lactone efflux protein
MIAIAFMLGFLGYLPLGNINMLVVQLSLTETPRKVLFYILFVALMEMIYCALIIEGTHVLLEQPGLLTALKWLAVVLFLVLGLLSFFHRDGSNASKRFSGISKGVFIAIVNPLQVPFWLVWSVYLMQNNWLNPQFFTVSFFALFTALGTICVLWLYALGGKQLVQRLELNHGFLNRFIGVVLIALALAQLFKLLYHS